MKKTASTLLLAGLLTLPIGAQEVTEEAKLETKQKVSIQRAERGRHGQHSKLCACQEQGEKGARRERFQEGRRADVARGIRRELGEHRGQIGQVRRHGSELGGERDRSRRFDRHSDRVQGRRGAESRRGAERGRAEGRRGGECKHHGEKGRGKDEIRSRIGRLGDRRQDSGRSRGGERARIGPRGGEHPRRFEGRR